MEKQLFEQLREFYGSKTIIVGIGNILKGDDGAGPLICQQLKQAKISAELIDAGTVPENYIQPIIRKAPQNLIVIDAIDFGDEPGSIKIFKPEQLDSIVISTHSLSPGLFADLVCKDISVDVYFVGIQPAQIMLDQPVSKEVKVAIQQLSEVLTEIFPAED
jgi:hydrogenase 3 maturation protease